MHVTSYIKKSQKHNNNTKEKLTRAQELPSKQKVF